MILLFFLSPKLEVSSSMDLFRICDRGRVLPDESTLFPLKLLLTCGGGTAKNCDVFGIEPEFALNGE